ncbi:MAG: hypothetical protein JNL69_11780, partial [Bacteroidia bacterium]|nr:hypothetical protein [Bacteroidia bacterium]
IIKLIDKKIPLIITLNGKGILHKKINISENEDDKSLLGKVFPNANINEFSFQKTIINNNSMILSVVRNSVIENIFTQLSNKGITNISSVMLGPFSINLMLNVLNNGMLTNSSIILPGYTLHTANGSISDVITNIENQNYTDFYIADSKINADTITSFSSAFVALNGNKLNSIENSAIISNIIDDYKQKIKFEFNGWALLAITLLMLTINYFIFNHYWNVNTGINNQLSFNQSAIQNLELLKKEYQEKKIFLEQNGLLESSKTSFYADRLATDLPSSIQWTELYIHPIKKKEANQDENVFAFETKTIFISGKSQRSIDVNDWIKNIKAKNWVKDVVLINYFQDTKNEKGDFLIEIKLN